MFHLVPTALDPSQSCPHAVALGPFIRLVSAILECLDDSVPCGPSKIIQTNACATFRGPEIAGIAVNDR